MIKTLTITIIYHYTMIYTIELHIEPIETHINIINIPYNYRYLLYNSTATSKNSYHITKKSEKSEIFSQKFVKNFFFDKIYSIITTHASHYTHNTRSHTHHYNNFHTNMTMPRSFTRLHTINTQQHPQLHAIVLIDYPPWILIIHRAP